MKRSILAGIWSSLLIFSVAFSQEPTATKIKNVLGDEFAITEPPDPNHHDEPTENNPIVNTEEDTPVVLESMDFKPGEFGKRPWQKPNFTQQKDVLGYSIDTFKTPPGLEPQVNFWIDIFAKYTTDQGVLHDSRYINIVYDTLDFRKTEGYDKMSEGQRHHSREKLVKQRKKEIVEMLKKFQKIETPDTLTADELRIWKMFEKVDEPKKFVEAEKKGRLRFQLGLRDRFIEGIYYSGRYLQDMEALFQEAGLPAELTRLPFVESSFNIKARSKVGASGIWQFMRRTGRLYMKVGPAIDERNDPLIATRGAARLLKFNYNLLQSWPLAVTAYNFGPSGMKREADKYKTGDLIEIARKSKNRHFGFASSNFYASFLAALEVERNANKYFGGTIWGEPIVYDEIVLSRPVKFSAIVKVFGDDEEKAFIYNPQFTRAIRKGHMAIQKGSHVRVPKNTGDTFLATVDKMPKREQANLKTGVVPYVVAQGDTLSGIAHEFGVSISTIKEVNGIDRASALRTGQVLHIPAKE